MFSMPFCTVCHNRLIVIQRNGDCIAGSNINDETVKFTVKTLVVNVEA